MNYRNMRMIGRFLRSVQTHKLSAAFSAKDYVRVTYTHQVLREHEQNFESLVALLLQTHTVLRPAEFFKMFDAPQTVKGRNVLITFDDGLMSSYRAIKNMASKHGIKMIMFVPTQILELKTVEDKKRFAWQQLNFNQGQAPKSFREEEFLTMGKDEIVDLHKDGHAIFPHTHTHKRLNEIQDERTAAEEFSKPKRILEELLQHSMDAFAFPVGTERVVSGFAFSRVRREYKYCFSALSGKNTPSSDPYFLHRDCMNADYDPDHVRNVEDGVFDMYYQLKRSQLCRAAQYSGINVHAA